MSIGKKNKKTRPTQVAEGFATHPRYGSTPHYTGDNPAPSTTGVNLHWNAETVQEIIARYTAVFGKPPEFLTKIPRDLRPADNRIPDTAIAADLKRQTPATVPVTHYFDIKRVCADCKQSFIFYAKEQKYWYEELGFPLEADAKRCARCRKAVRAVARLRATYEVLLRNSARTPDEDIRLLDSLLKLIEQRIFTVKKLTAARALVKKMPESSQEEFRRRIEKLETG